MFSVRQPDITKSRLSSSLIVVVELEGKTLEFPLSPLVSVRSIKDINQEKHFRILNEYLDYKGNNFKLALFNTLEKLHIEATKTLSSEVKLPFSTSYIDPLIELFDFNHIEKFLIEVHHLPIPPDIKKEFTYEMLEYGRDDQEQTYITSDYISLIALIIGLKVILLPFTIIVYYNKKDLDSILLEYILLQSVKQTKLFKEPAMIKLTKLIKRIILRADDDVENNSYIRTLEKNLPNEEVPYYILAMSMFQKVFPYSIPENVNNIKTIINIIYNYTTSKLQNNSDISRAIKQKTPLKDSDNTTGEDESIIESHRATFNIETGTIVEYTWALNSIHKVLTLGIEIDENVLRLVTPMFIHKDNFKITKLHNSLISLIFKKYIDPRVFEYLPLEPLFNLVIVGAAYLITNKNCLYKYLISNPYDTTNLVMKGNLRIPQDIKEKLVEKYPYTQIVLNPGKVKRKLFVENLIEDIHKMTQEYNYIPLIDIDADVEIKDVRLALIDLLLL